MFTVVSWIGASVTVEKNSSRKLMMELFCKFLAFFLLWIQES